MSNQFNRRSIRLKGYDYSKEGLYFVTICCQDRACRFGNVVNDEMILNEAGKVAEACWLKIPEHFPNVILGDFVIMPNHVHGIVEIVGAKNFSPEEIDISPEEKRAKDVSPQRVPIINGTSKTVGSIVRGFKIGVTKWVRQNTNIYDLWQRNYYENIIRDEKAYHNIAQYILNNPLNWGKDKFHS